MTKPLDREELIRLLDELGSEEDEAVLSAARAIHESVTNAEHSWDELLIDHGSSGGQENLTSYAEEEDDSSLAPEDRSAKNAETLALVEKMLAKPDISDDFRHELEDYKNDIAAEEFYEADRKYVRALYDRLNKSN